MAELNLGRLLRLKGATDSMVGNGEATAETAVGLTEGYTRVRDQALELVAGTGLEGEFGAMFPESRPSPGHRRPADQGYSNGNSKPQPKLSAPKPSWANSQVGSTV